MSKKPHDEKHDEVSAAAIPVDRATI